jgi:hypothetical protein
MKSRSLSQSNAHLRGPDAHFLHARNVATSTAVETGKPVDEYLGRCLSRLQQYHANEKVPQRNPR